MVFLQNRRQEDIQEKERNHERKAEFFLKVLSPCERQPCVRELCGQVDWAAKCNGRPEKMSARKKKFCWKRKRMKGEEEEEEKRTEQNIKTRDSSKFPAFLGPNSVAHGFRCLAGVLFPGRKLSQSVQIKRFKCFHCFLRTQGVIRRMNYHAFSLGWKDRSQFMKLTFNKISDRKHRKNQCNTFFFFSIIWIFSAFPTYRRVSNQPPVL